MTLEEMKTLVKRYGFDEGDPLTAWLNAAMHDIEDDFDWPWLEMAINREMVSGSNTITLAADTLKIITVKDLTNLRKLNYYNRHKWTREIQDPTETGFPEIYTLRNTNEIQVWRVTQEAINFEVMYQAITPDLVNPADIPTTAGQVWPVNAHYPIVMKAAAIALQAENEEDRAKNALDQYEKALEKLRKKFGERELDEPTTVQDVQGYGENVRGY